MRSQLQCRKRFGARVSFLTLRGIADNSTRQLFMFKVITNRDEESC